VYTPGIEHYFGQYLEDAEVESFTHGLKKILVAQQTDKWVVLQKVVEDKRGSAWELGDATTPRI